MAATPRDAGDSGWVVRQYLNDCEVPMWFVVQVGGDFLRDEHGICEFDSRAAALRALRSRKLVEAS